MSRSSLTEIWKGRNPQVFADQVRALRKQRGYSLRELASKAEVSLSTIQRIEAGQGCTHSVEHKVAQTLRGIEEGMYVKPQREVFCHSLKSWKWNFAKREDAQAYADRYHKEFTLIPLEIQHEDERLRLGRLKLSQGFLQNRTCNLESGMFVISLLEVYGPIISSGAEGTLIHLHCLRGAVRVVFGEDSIELQQGDMFQGPLVKPFYEEPLHPIGSKDLPPLVEYIELTKLPSL